MMIFVFYDLWDVVGEIMLQRDHVLISEVLITKSIC